MVPCNKEDYFPFSSNRVSVVDVVNSRMSEKNNPGTLASVTFRTIAHFYDPDDPSPEYNRELTDRAENAILLAVLDVPDKKISPICDHIELRFPASDLTPGRQTAIVSATRSHFSNRSIEIKRSSILTVRVGLRECWLTIGVAIPSFIGIAALTRFQHLPLAIILLNVLVIFCWVVIWQPFQSLVFDRWTLAEKSKVYRIIADMDIGVLPSAGP